MNKYEVQVPVYFGGCRRVIVEAMTKSAARLLAHQQIPDAKTFVALNIKVKKLQE